MIFRRFTRKRPVTTSLLAGAVLVAMAVVGWGVPVKDMLGAAGLSLLVVFLMAVPAALFVLIIVLIRYLRNKREE